MTDPFVSLILTLGLVLLTGMALGSDTPIWLYLGVLCAALLSTAWTVATLVDALSRCSV